MRRWRYLFCRSSRRKFSSSVWPFADCTKEQKRALPHKRPWVRGWSQSEGLPLFWAEPMRRTVLTSKVLPNTRNICIVLYIMDYVQLCPLKRELICLLIPPPPKKICLPSLLPPPKKKKNKKIGAWHRHWSYFTFNEAAQYCPGQNRLVRGWAEWSIMAKIVPLKLESRLLNINSIRSTKIPPLCNVQKSINVEIKNFSQPYDF